MTRMIFLWVFFVHGVGLTCDVIELGKVFRYFRAWNDFSLDVALYRLFFMAFIKAIYYIKYPLISIGNQLHLFTFWEKNGF